MAQEQTSTQVAEAATQPASGSLSGLILLGTMGASDDQQALVRTGQGDVVKLRVGDRIGKAPIIAIRDGRLAYAKGGTTRWLEQPVK